MPNRRDFIQHTCIACVGAVAFGIWLTEESCAYPHVLNTKPIGGKIRFPLSKMKGKDAILLRTKLYTEDILIVKKENAYHALLMKCTHKGVELEFKDTYLKCPAHGSVFDFDGKVLSAPASRPLKMFPVTEENNQLTLEIS